MTQENWWILEQQGLHRVADFLREVERDNLAREAGFPASPLRSWLASVLRSLAGRLDRAEPAAEPGLAPAR